MEFENFVSWGTRLQIGDVFRLPKTNIVVRVSEIIGNELHCLLVVGSGYVVLNRKIRVHKLMKNK
ncbi:hypothetical protein D0T56_05250 [Dysgonomonas sp. 520]|nr:hypothetical protein [Dysgonomonas sp. 520]